MFFYRFCSTAILLQFLLFATPAVAQVAPQNGPYLSFEELEELWQSNQETLPWLNIPKPQIEGPLPLPRVRPPQAPHGHSSPQANEEKRFSFWGYRHAELHANGLVAKLQILTGQKCCDSITSGECRISSVDLPARMVQIDGEWCPYDDKTKVVVLDDLQKLSDGKETIALVCAGKTHEMVGTTGPKKRTCSTSYCIGILPVRM